MSLFSDDAFRQLQEDYFLLEADYIELAAKVTDAPTGAEANLGSEGTLREDFFLSIIESSDLCTVFTKLNKYFPDSKMVSFDEETMVLESKLSDSRSVLVALPMEIISYVIVEYREPPVTEIYNPDLGASTTL